MSDRIEDLIPRIYEAALELEHWPDVLRRVSRLTGDSVALLCHEPTARLVCDDPLPLTPGVGHRWTHNYDRGVLERSSPSCWTVAGNPLVAATTNATVGAVFDRREFLDDDAYVCSPAVQMMALSQDLFHFVLSTPQREDAIVSALSIARTKRQGPIENELLEVFRSLVPHVGTAMRIHARLHQLTSEAQTLRAAVDRLGAAVLLVDQECRARYANAEAERALRTNDGLTLVAGRLIAPSTRVHRRLEALVGRCRASALQSQVRWRSPDHPAPIRQPRLQPVRGAGNRCWREWLAARRKRDSLHHRPGARGIAFHRVARPAVRPHARRGEVALLVTQGRGLPHVARDLGITLNTAKTHLKAIYGKTGTDRQARLTRLILESVPPLAPGAAALHAVAQKSGKETGPM